MTKLFILLNDNLRVSVVMRLILANVGAPPNSFLPDFGLLQSSINHTGLRRSSDSLLLNAQYYDQNS